MSFDAANQKSDRLFDNADSFAIEFDSAWNQLSSDLSQSQLSKEDKLNIVLQSINSHPFLQSRPLQAKQVALFRIKLLKLK